MTSPFSLRFAYAKQALGLLELGIQFLGDFKRPMLILQCLFKISLISKYFTNIGQRKSGINCSAINLQGCIEINYGRVILSLIFIDLADVHTGNSNPVGIVYFLKNDKCS